MISDGNDTSSHIARPRVAAAHPRNRSAGLRDRHRRVEQRRLLEPLVDIQAIVALVAATRAAGARAVSRRASAASARGSRHPTAVAGCH